MLDFVHNPRGEHRIGDYVRQSLTSGEWTHLRAAIAFVKASGMRHVTDDFARFGEAGGVTRMAVGVDTQGSSIEGLQRLLDSMRGDSKVYVVHNENDSTFHPKLWLFENADAGELLIGSGNLTGGGLFTNYEVLLRLRLDKSNRETASVLDSARGVLESWTTPDQQLVRELNSTLLAELVAQGYVVSEAVQRARRERERAAQGAASGKAPRLFASVKVPPPPGMANRYRTARGGRSQGSTVHGATASGVAQQGFLMTLQRTDVGRGQTKKGTKRRSPEVFIPLVARDHTPDFWGWPKAFAKDPKKKGKRDRRGVQVRLGGKTISVSMMTWPDKSDFRLRSEALRSAGKIGDILRLERVERGKGYEYYAEVIPQGTGLFHQFNALCTEPVRNSKKKWGYYELGTSEA